MGFELGIKNLGLGGFANKMLKIFTIPPLYNISEN